MGNVPRHFSQDFPARFSHKIFPREIFPQDFPARFLPQGFPTRIFPQDFPTILQFPARFLREDLAGKIFPQDFPGTIFREDLAGNHLVKVIFKIFNSSRSRKIPHNYLQTISEGNFQNMQFHLDLPNFHL